MEPKDGSVESGPGGEAPSAPSQPAPGASQQQPLTLPRAERMSLPREFALFLRTNKAYWLVPLIVVLLLFSALVALGGTAISPFLYAFF
ncbi:MAG: hypothetical protein HYZ53_21770 [Planctomycetes bacterium]|nr:hypothetical protein [Planctomycetota bacterium]